MPIPILLVNTEGNDDEQLPPMNESWAKNYSTAHRSIPHHLCHHCSTAFSEKTHNLVKWTLALFSLYR